MQEQHCVRDEALFVNISGGDVRQIFHGPISVHAESNASKSCEDNHTGARRKLPQKCNQIKDSSTSLQKGSINDEKVVEQLMMNDVWIHTENASIISIFSKTKELLKNKRQFLANEYKRILPTPEQLLANAEDTVKVKFQCDKPDNMQITSIGSGQFKMNGKEARKDSHSLHFSPDPHPNELMYFGPYKVFYHAELFNQAEQVVEGGISSPLNFSWPLQRVKFSQDDQTLPIFDIGNNSKKTFRQKNFAPEEDFEYYSQINSSIGQSCAEESSVAVTMTPEGGTVQTDGCKVQLQPGVLMESKEVKMSVNCNPDNSPDAGTTISNELKYHAPKCIPGEVTLTSFLTPKPGEELRVLIMSKAGDAEWKQIQEVMLGKGKLLQYQVSHFCSHVAVVSEEEEKKGEYHLLNDVWIQKETGRILSIFWKDEIALRKGSKALESEHNRILPLPEEVIVSVGETVAVEFHCDDNGQTEISNVDGSNSQMKITHELMKKPFFSLLFRCHFSPLSNSTEFQAVLYHAKVLDSFNQDTKGGFSAPLHYKWQKLSFDQTNISAADTDEEVPWASVQTSKESTLETASTSSAASGHGPGSHSHQSDSPDPPRSSYARHSFHAKINWKATTTSISEGQEEYLIDSTIFTSRNTFVVVSHLRDGQLERRLENNMKEQGLRPRMDFSPIFAKMGDNIRFLLSCTAPKGFSFLLNELLNYTVDENFLHKMYCVMATSLEKNTNNPIRERLEIRACIENGNQVLLDGHHTFYHDWNEYTYGAGIGIGQYATSSGHITTTRTDTKEEYNVKSADPPHQGSVATNYYGPVDQLSFPGAGIGQVAISSGHITPTRHGTKEDSSRVSVVSFLKRIKDRFTSALYGKKEDYDTKSDDPAHQESMVTPCDEPVDRSSLRVNPTGPQSTMASPVSVAIFSAPVDQSSFRGAGIGQYATSSGHITTTRTSTKEEYNVKSADE